MAAAAAAVRSSSCASTEALMKVLTTPTKIANALDWKKQVGGSIATIDVHADRIGLTISKHPSSAGAAKQQRMQEQQQSKPVLSFNIPMRRKGKRKVPDSSRQQLSELVRENNVCGFVVSWPVQSDTGLMGAACGRTLHAIEELLEPPTPTSSSSESSATSSEDNSSTSNDDGSSAAVFTSNRKLCLWDGVHMEQPPVDKFGRSSVYSRTCDYKHHQATTKVDGSGRILENNYEYRASKEQYHEDESIVATKVWEDFVKTNWPVLYQQQQRRDYSQSSSSSSHHQHQQSHQKKTLVTARAY